MSNIPYSKRIPTRIDFFDKAIDLRVKIIQYIDYDFGLSKRTREDGSIYLQYWIIAKIRDSIYNAIQDCLLNLTQANTIRITNLYEYNERRRYMTKAIGDLEFIIQEIQFAIRSFNVKADKYCLLIKDIENVVTSIKNWRKSDNLIKNKLLDKNKDKE